MKQSVLSYRLAGLSFAFAICAIDQRIKAMILAAKLPITILPFFNIVLVHNRGISFGMLSNMQAFMPFILGILTSIITIILLFWLIKANEKSVIISLTFIIGGALGNIIDRYAYGAVIDFLDFHIGDWHYPAFNIADSSIFIGVALFFFSNIITKKPKEVV